jgi:hypothetical protein
MTDYWEANEKDYLGAYEFNQRGYDEEEEDFDEDEGNRIPKCGNCEADDCENCAVGVWVREHKGDVI